MKLKFDKDSETKVAEIFQAIASPDRDKSWEAETALAAFVGPIVDQVLEQAATSSSIFQTIRYDLSKGAPSIPIDTYFGNQEGEMLVWSQNIPGSLASNLVSGADEYRFTTSTIYSAVSMLKKYAAEARLDVVGKSIERLAQEVLLKQEWMLWSVLLGALGAARKADGTPHLLSATTAGTFQLDDLNRLWTMIKRLRTSWSGGTPVGVPGRGLTDLFVSPEVMEDIRAMAYNPMNTRGVPDSVESTALGLPDAMRQEAWKSGGSAGFLGVKIHELLEFGVGQPYNYLFDLSYSGSSPTFAWNTQEIVLGADLSIDSAIKVEGTDRDSDSVFKVKVDDQFVSRSEKLGWWGKAEFGAAVADTKAFVALIV